MPRSNRLNTRGSQTLCVQLAVLKKFFSSVALVATVPAWTASMTRLTNVSAAPDADIPAPLGEDEREDITAEIGFTTPFAPESEEGWTPLDRLAAPADD